MALECSVVFGYARDTSLGSFLVSEARGWLAGRAENKGSVSRTAGPSSTARVSRVIVLVLVQINTSAVEKTKQLQWDYLV